MPISFFKPNRAKSGSLASFSFNSKEGVAYIQLVKQCGEMTSGPFKGAKDKTNIQLSMIELGACLNVIERKVKFNTVHKSESGTRIINFEPYYVEKSAPGDDPQKEFKGFSLSTSIEGQGFRIGFTSNEARVLRKWFEFVLDHCFSAIYSGDKTRAKEYLEKHSLKKTNGIKIDNGEI